MSAVTEVEPRVVEVGVAGTPRRGLLTRLVAKLGHGGVQVALAAVALFWLMPVFGLFVASLRDERANAGSGWWTIFTEPTQLTIDNYAGLLSDGSVLRSLLNTVFIAVPSTVLVIVLSALAAYALSWIDFPGRAWLTALVVGLLVMPVQVALIPVAKLFGALDLFGTITGVVLFHVAFGLPFAIFLLRNFFTGIPRDLVEAARMDGATEAVIFRRVVLPIGKPAIASLAIFQFLWVWNDLLVALVFADQDSAPITVALRGQLRQFGSNIDLLASGAFLSMVVPLAVFLAFQRYFVQGVLAGSTK
ncbi:carbohydrate ABC transporter permease [Actinosynnema sp. CA-299493]